MTFERFLFTIASIVPQVNSYAKLPSPVAVSIAACCFPGGSESTATKVGELEDHPSAETSELRSGIQVVHSMRQLGCCQIHQNYHADRKTATRGIVMYPLLSKKAEGTLFAHRLVRLVIDEIMWL